MLDDINELFGSLIGNWEQSWVIQQIALNLFLPVLFWNAVAGATVGLCWRRGLPLAALLLVLVSSFPALLAGVLAAWAISTFGWQPVYLPLVRDVAPYAFFLLVVMVWGLAVFFVAKWPRKVLLAPKKLSKS